MDPQFWRTFAQLQARPRGEVVKMSDCEHRCRQGRRHRWVVPVGKMDFAVDQVIMDLGVESRLDLGRTVLSN